MWQYLYYILPERSNKSDFCLIFTLDRNCWLYACMHYQQGTSGKTMQQLWSAALLYQTELPGKSAGVVPDCITMSKSLPTKTIQCSSPHLVLDGEWQWGLNGLPTAKNRWLCFILFTVYLDYWPSGIEGWQMPEPLGFSSSMPDVGT